MKRASTSWKLKDFPSMKFINLSQFSCKCDFMKTHVFPFADVWDGVQGPVHARQALYH
jgi:hypothetical protein